MNILKEKPYLIIIVLVLIGLSFFYGKEKTITEYSEKLDTKEKKLKVSVKVNSELNKTISELRKVNERLQESSTTEVTERVNTDGSSIKTTKIVFKKETSKEDEVKTQSNTNFKNDVNVDVNSKEKDSSSLVTKKETKIKAGSSWGVGVLFRPNESVGLNNGAVQLITPKLGMFRGTVQGQRSQDETSGWVGIIIEGN